MSPIRRWFSSGRLVYAGPRADGPEFWDRHWRAVDLPAQIASARKGELTFLERSFLPFIHSGRPVLEAGCGTGRIALALHTRGFTVAAVEFSESTLRAARALAPEAPFIVGDVFRLPFPDAAFGTCISLGVMEHYPDGPAAPLAEARRVTAPGGFLLVSVPHLNALRRAKVLLRRFPAGPAPEPFYQYAFARADFVRRLAAAGFSLRTTKGYGVWKGLRDEIGFLRWIDRRGWMPPRLASALERLPLLRRWVGHMILFVARKAPA